MTSRFEKQPTEVKDYDINSVDFFEGTDDFWVLASFVIDSITVPPLEIGPTPLADYELVGTPPQIVKVWVGGGLDGEKYKVTALLTSDAGRVEEEEFYVKVKDK